jgi:hypothetical protein
MLSGDRTTDQAMIERIRAVDLRGCGCRYETIACGPYLLILDSLRPCVGLEPPLISITGQRRSSSEKEVNT